jgi:transposase
MVTHPAASPMPWSRKPKSHPSTRPALCRTGIRAVIPQRSDQMELRERRGSPGGRLLALDTDACRGRNVVEHTFCPLKSWRGIANRYDKHARNSRAGHVLVCIFLSGL